MWVFRRDTMRRYTVFVLAGGRVRRKTERCDESIERAGRRVGEMDTSE
jgi:hypothetical protein